MKQRNGNNNNNNNNGNSNKSNQYTQQSLQQLQQQTANLHIGNYHQQQSNFDSFTQPIPNSSFIQPNQYGNDSHLPLPATSLRRAQSAPTAAQPDFVSSAVEFDSKGSNNNLFYSSASHNPNLFISSANASNNIANNNSNINRMNQDNNNMFQSHLNENADSTSKSRQPSTMLNIAPTLSLGRSTSLGPTIPYAHDDDDDISLPSKSLAGSKPSLYTGIMNDQATSNDQLRLITPSFSLQPNKQENANENSVSYSGFQPGTVFLSPPLGSTSLFSPDMNAVLPRGLGLSPFLSPALMPPKLDVVGSAMPPLGLPGSFVEQQLQQSQTQMSMNSTKGASSILYESQDPNSMIPTFNSLYSNQMDATAAQQGLLFYPTSMSNQMGQNISGYYPMGTDSVDPQGNMMMMSNMGNPYDEQFNIEANAMGYYPQAFDNQQQMYFNGPDMNSTQSFYGAGYHQQNSFGRGASQIHGNLNNQMNPSRAGSSHRGAPMTSNNSNTSNNTSGIPATLSRPPLNPNSKAWSMPATSNGSPNFMNPISQQNISNGRGMPANTRNAAPNRLERTEGTRPRSQLLEEVRTAMKSFSNVAGPSNGNAPPTPTNSGNQKGGAGGRHGPGNLASNATPHQQYQPSSLIPSSESATQMSKLPWKLQDIKGHVLEFAQDQFGSRFIQQNLESKDVSDEDKEDMFQEIVNDISDLCRDVFGNYCIQKLLAMGTVSQQFTIVTSAIEGNVLWLSKDTYGCRTVQAMITHVFCTNDGQVNETVIPIDRQNKMLQELNGKVMECAQDQNANHVLQVFLEKIRPISRINFVLTAFKGNMKQLAMHFCGCRVVQRVLENASSAREAALRIQRGEARPGDAGESDINLGPLLDELVDSANDLVKCQFGNYVIQHLMDHGGDEFAPARRKLVQIVKDNLLAFATHKFASNVVEAVLQHSDKKTRREVIAVMIKRDPNTNQTLLHAMMKDAYANYVVQRALQTAEPEQLTKVAEIVKSSSSELKKLTYGKHILTALDKALSVSSNSSASAGASSFNR